VRFHIFPDGRAIISTRVSSIGPRCRSRFCPESPENARFAFPAAFRFPNSKCYRTNNRIIITQTSRCWNITLERTRSVTAVDRVTFIGTSSGTPIIITFLNTFHGLRYFSKHFMETDMFFFFDRNFLCQLNIS